jgi:hypothetical protein
MSICQEEVWSNIGREKLGRMKTSSRLVVESEIGLIV